MKQLLSNTFTSLYLLIATHPSAFAIDTADHGQNQITWLREKGGVVNEHLEIRREDPNDPTSRFGMFTNADLKKDQVLLVIPQDCVIEKLPEDEYEEKEDAEMECGTVRSLIKEMKLGDESNYAPYVNYLLAEPWGQLPSAWSKAGKKLLNVLLTKYTEDPIPPLEPDDWLDSWYDGCYGEKNPFEENASLMVLQRSWDDIMIPIFDMMSHRNGKWHNTKSNSVHGDADIIVSAKQDIPAGSEINTSYNMCEDCGGRAETYGTPEILRDYGFIEQYPQRWIFEEISFEIDEDQSGDLFVNWIGSAPSDRSIKYLQNVEEGMRRAGEKLSQPHDDVPENELATIRQYHKELSIAISVAINQAYGDDEACPADDQTCTVPNNRYKNLNKNSKDLNLQPDTCDIDSIMEFESYDAHGQVQTQYQLITIFNDPNTKDMCFDLDGTVQICTSYRPHYHEPAVHWPAHYLKEVKRVLFVGGGDSMLLHEVLKYKTLEKVVGLELDQKVTRMSFKQFGSQPHWNNDKVEWWFGDATKSLLMLPKEYFGSFDMVLVDLSETVMSFKVTDELDIMEALSLLLTPEGIMLKNELYFEDMSGIFEHTVEIVYEDVPVICSQAMVFGSNAIHFLEDEKTEHNVPNFLLGPLDNESHSNWIHSYTKRSDNLKKHCKRDDDELEKVPSQQKSSPGIIMIVEAEDALVTGLSLKELENKMIVVAKEQGLTVASSVVPEEGNEDNVVVVVLNEGYIVGRCWEDKKYCGFDIHLWSDFGKQDDIKLALIAAVGGSNSASSSFRIVAGGMFGVPSWKREAKQIGPRRTNPCKRRESRAPSTNIDTSSLGTIIEENLKTFASSEDPHVRVVVCGDKSDGPCEGLTALKGLDGSDDIVDIWSCATGANESDEGYSLELYTCERKVLQALTDALAGDKKIGAIVFDPNATYPMGQVLFRIFQNLKNQMNMLSEETVVLGTSVGEETSWQGVFVSRFHKEIIEDEPGFEGTTLFKGLDKSYLVHVATSDDLFVEDLKQIANVVEERSGIVSEVRDVRGGLPHFQHNFEPSRMYRPEDYDSSDGLAQWTSQEQLETQTVMQFEKQKTKVDGGMIKGAIESILPMIERDFSEMKGVSGAKVHEFGHVGDGRLFVALWPGSRVIILWDGKDHMDINLTTSKENEKLANYVKKEFIKKVPSMKSTLRDEQPRGYGRVINFASDIADLTSPIWS